MRPENFVGESCETTCAVNGVQVRTLLDTGSTISTITQEFLELTLPECQVKPLDFVLPVECANGTDLPYIGYVEVDISPFVSESDTILTLLLVVPTTPYRRTVPMLLGTKVLGMAWKTHKNMESGSPHAWAPVFRIFSQLEKNLNRNHGRLAQVKAKEAFILKKHQGVQFTGKFSKMLNATACTAMIQPCRRSKLPKGVELSPIVVKYQPLENSHDVPVVLYNHTNRDIRIQSNSILCELHSVEVQHIPTCQQLNVNGSNTDACPIDDDDDNLLKEFELPENTDVSLRELLLKYKHVCSRSEFDIGHTTRVKHKIEMTDDTPIKQRHRRIPPSMYQEVQEHIEMLLTTGIIRESESPWASPAVLVRKKSGKLRFCVDFRLVNNRTIKDAFSLPRMEECFDFLSGARYFSCLDLRSGYYQVEMEEDAKEKTAFTLGPLGFYEFNRMCFGLSNSPACFQRLMQKCLGDIHLKECMVFLDDVVIHSKTLEEHLERLEHVLRRLQDNGLKLNPSKCKFFQKRITYLGHVISENGIETDPEKIQKVQDWPRPSNVDDVRAFLGFTGYYRRFVRDFSRISRPLNEMLAGIQRKKSKKKITEPKPWKWGAEEENAFRELKTQLTTPPILGFPDFTKPYILHVDACGSGLGAVLCQHQDGQDRVISYASRRVSGSESNYPAHKLEFLALKWSVTDKFSDYLYGNTFEVLTDNNPLTYVLASAKLDATGHRWLAALSGYNFTIKYRPGINNGDADGLSRLPNRISGEEIVTEAVVAAIFTKIDTKPYMETVCCSIQPTITEDKPFDLHDISTIDMRKSQREDRNIGLILPYV